MADLGTWANIAEIAGGLFVIGGLTFTVLELRRNREQHRRDAAYEIFSNMSSREFIQGLKLLADLPDDGLTKEQLNSLPKEQNEDLQWVLFQFENLGTMVGQGMVPIELAMEFYGLSIINTWKKLGPYIRDLRREKQQPLYFHYVQEMAEEVERRVAVLNAKAVKTDG